MSSEDQKLLKDLEDLYKDGLITQQEYNNKKKQFEKKRALFVETDTSKKVSKDGNDLEGRIKECTEWIEKTLAIKLQGKFADNLKDGKLLFELANKIEKDMCPWSKFKNSKVPFLCLNNITEFVKGIQRFGVSKDDVFISNDLYYEKNLKSVVDTLYMFAWAAYSKGWEGPKLGKLYKKGSYFDKLKQDRDDEKQKENERRRRMSQMRRDKLAEAENKKKQRLAAIARKELKEYIAKIKADRKSPKSGLSKLSKENDEKLIKALEDAEKWVDNSDGKEQDEILGKKTELFQFVEDILEDEKIKDRKAMNNLVDFFNNLSKKANDKNDPLSKLSKPRKKELDSSLDKTRNWIRRNSKAKAADIIPKQNELKKSVDDLLNEQEKENKEREEAKKDFKNLINDFEKRSKAPNDPLSKISKGNKDKLDNGIKKSKDWLNDNPDALAKEINDKKQDLKDLVDTLFGDEAEQKKKRGKNLAEKFDKSLDDLNKRRKDKKDPLSKVGRKNRKLLDEGVKKANNFIVKVKDKQGKLKDFDDNDFPLDIFLEDVEEEKNEIDNLVDSILKDEEEKQKEGEKLAKELQDAINDIEDRTENADDPLSQLNPTTEKKLNEGLKKPKEFLIKTRADDGRLVNLPDEEFDVELFKDDVKKHKKDLDQVVGEILDQKKKDDEKQKQGQKIVDELLDAIKDIEEKKNDPKNPLSRLDDKLEDKLDAQLDKAREFLSDVIQEDGKLKNPGNDEEFDVDVLRPKVQKQKKDLDEVVDEILKDKLKKDKAQNEGEKLLKDFQDAIDDIEKKQKDKKEPLGTLDKKNNDKLNDAIQKAKQFLVDTRSEDGKLVNPDDEEFDVNVFADNLKKKKKDLDQVVGEILADKKKKDKDQIEGKKIADDLQNKIDDLGTRKDDPEDPISEADGPTKEKLTKALENGKNFLVNHKNKDGDLKGPEGEDFDVDAFRQGARKISKMLDEIVGDIKDKKMKKDKAQVEGQKILQDLEDQIEDVEGKSENPKDPLSEVDGPAKEKLKKALQKAKDFIKDVKSEDGKLHNPNSEEFDVDTFKDKVKKQKKDLDQVVGEILADKKKKDKEQIEGKTFAKALKDKIDQIEGKIDDKKDPLSQVDGPAKEKLKKKLKEAKDFLNEVTSEDGKLHNPNSEEFDVDTFKDKAKKKIKDLDQVVGEVLADKKKKDKDQVEGQKVLKDLEDQIDKLKDKSENPKDPLSEVDGPAKEKLRKALQKAKDFIKDVKSEDGKLHNPNSEEFDVDTFKDKVKKQKKDLDQVVGEILDDKRKKDKAQNEGRKELDDFQDKIDDIKEKLEDKKDPLSKVDGPAKEKLKKALDKAKDFITDVVGNDGKLRNPKGEEFDVDTFKDKVKKQKKDLDQVVDEILKEKANKDKKDQDKAKKLTDELKGAIADLDDKRKDKKSPLSQLGKKDKAKLEDAIEDVKEFLQDVKGDKGKFRVPGDEEFDVDVFEDKVKKKKKDLDEVVGEIINDTKKKIEGEDCIRPLQDLIDEITEGAKDKDSPISSLPKELKDKLMQGVKNSKDFIQDLKTDDGEFKPNKGDEFDVDTLKDEVKKEKKDLDDLYDKVLKEAQKIRDGKKEMWVHLLNLRPCKIILHDADGDKLLYNLTHNFFKKDRRMVVKDPERELHVEFDHPRRYASFSVISLEGEGLTEKKKFDLKDDGQHVQIAHHYGKTWFRQSKKDDFPPLPIPEGLTTRVNFYLYGAEATPEKPYEIFMDGKQFKVFGGFNKQLNGFFGQFLKPLEGGDHIGLLKVIDRVNGEQFEGKFNFEKGVHICIFHDEKKLEVHQNTEPFKFGQKNINGKKKIVIVNKK